MTRYWGRNGNCGPGNPFSTWHCETIDPAGSWVNFRNGDFASIAVSPSGLATVAYYRLYVDHADGNLTGSLQIPFQVFLPLVMRNQ